MKTDVDCLVCFMRQALSTTKMSSDDSAVLQQAVCQAGELLATLDLSLSPPENAVFLYSLIADITGNADPFSSLKKNSNDFGLHLEGTIQVIIESSPDPFFTAVRFAVAGNIIDYGVQNSFDADAVLKNCQEVEFALNEAKQLRQALSEFDRKPEVLYLADNCGEIVFDKLMIRQLVQLGCSVTMAVRGQVIINDATLEDAHYCGVDLVCEVVDNGTVCPGTPLKSCSKEFQDYFTSADFVLSKGQGNFETLSEEERSIYFLLTVKCPVVARHISKKKGLETGTLSGEGEMICISNDWVR